MEVAISTRLGRLYRKGALLNMRTGLMTCEPSTRRVPVRIAKRPITDGWSIGGY
jgi:hypothetical protein